MKNKKRGQPPKEVKRIAVKLSILPNIRTKGDKLAFSYNKSLSRLIEDLIEKECKTMKIKEANNG